LKLDGTTEASQEKGAAEDDRSSLASIGWHSKSATDEAGVRGRGVSIGGRMMREGSSPRARAHARSRIRHILKVTLDEYRLVDHCHVAHLVW
jgi:hypothetical protein